MQGQRSSGLPKDAITVKRRSKRRGMSLLVRAVLGLIAACVIVFFVGFAIFIEKVANADPPELPGADAITVLTGGAARIPTAIELLKNGSANRLLISGVNPSTSTAALAQAYPDQGHILECCVDIGHVAANTLGNAEEISEWVQDNEFRSLIVVTGAYHMPRSLIVIRRLLPDVQLIAYPVQRNDLDMSSFFSDRDTLKFLLKEYAKYLVVRLT